MSTEPAHTGTCDTPRCDEPAETITPEGYVCEACAAKLAAHYESTRERDADARGER
ncbi:hypothetical protein [Halopiger goleimassiliensis]|uniref:hypothetical protein n=1 Tax=Halopiger goleimassiliensis TaxID=1293048 RepID=UPI000A60FB6E|nr:hypothetical protein [Halopiger goleimassiliensis]